MVLPLGMGLKPWLYGCGVCANLLRRPREKQPAMARAVETKAERSPSLTDAEIEEVTASRKEIKAGKSKRFESAQDATKWLDSD